MASRTSSTDLCSGKWQLGLGRGCPGAAQLRHRMQGCVREDASNCCVSLCTRWTDRYVGEQRLFHIHTFFYNICLFSHQLVPIFCSAISVFQGANINQRDENGWTALMHAVHKNHQPSVQLLLDRNAEITGNDKNGKS